MDILYVSQYFPPEMGAPAARVHELARAWVRAGHRVTVLTGFPNHPTGRVPAAYRRALRRGTARDAIDGIEVVRTWLWAVPNRRPWERIGNYTSFFASAALRGIWLDRPAVVIGTSPQLLVGLAGLLLARRFRRPFVFEVRDLWPESLAASGVTGVGSRLYRALDRLATFLYRSADLVVPLTHPFCPAIASRAPHARMAVVENGVDTSLFRPFSDVTAIRERLGLRERFVVSYIGTVGVAHGLEVMLEAAAHLQRRLPEATFLLVGDGAERARLEARARTAGLDNVRFEGERPRHEIPAYIAASHVCLVVLRPSELFRTVLPSKLLEFMAAGRPVILGVSGLAADLVRECDAGLCVPPGDAAALAGAIGQLHGDPLLAAKLGDNGRAHVLRRYCREAKASQYLQVLRELAGTSCA